MATKVMMEALSPTMEEGRVIKWLKQQGDEVKSGETLAEVETDKAVMEIVARGDGILRKLLAKEGDASPVGTLIAVIALADENIDALIGQPAAAAQPAAQPAAAGSAQSEAAPPSGAASATTRGSGPAPVPGTPEESQGETSTAAQHGVLGA